MFAEWNKGDLESYLIEITAEVLRQVDAETGKPFVDIVARPGGLEGHRRLDRAERARPRHPRLRHRRGGLRPRRVVEAEPARGGAGDSSSAGRTCRRRRRTAFADDVRARRSTPPRSSRTRRASTRSSPAPRSTAGTSTRARVAKIWRGGCIIRAQFLNRIVDAYDENPNIADAARGAVLRRRPSRDGEAAWRRVVSTAALSGVPVPGFASALSYYDSLASDRLPAALMQGQRDFFGAHTYKRVDKEGTFHTLWSRRPHRDRDRGLLPLAAARPPA